jgi:hypothetical protein
VCVCEREREREKVSVCVRESVCVCARARGMYQRNAGELAVLVVEFQISDWEVGHGEKGFDFQKQNSILY